MTAGTELAWIIGRCPWCDDVKLEAVAVTRIRFRPTLVESFELLEESFDHLAIAHGADGVGPT